MAKCILDQTRDEILGKLPKKVKQTKLGQTVVLIKHANKRYRGKKVHVLKQHPDGTYNIRVAGTGTQLLVNHWQLKLKGGK